MKRPAKKEVHKVAQQAAPAMKKASGDGSRNSLPSYDHPGFQDV